MTTGMESQGPYVARGVVTVIWPGMTVAPGRGGSVAAGGGSLGWGPTGGTDAGLDCVELVAATVTTAVTTAVARMGGPGGTGVVQTRASPLALGAPAAAVLVAAG